MPLPSPNLDDRDFAALFRDARDRIPRFIPEWTDWNESDPGIALLQLQSWLAETILYRLNQLPDLNYIKFLQLLGVEPRPAQPARADLTFTLRENVAEPQILIPRGTVVGVSARGLEEPLFFETDRTLIAISARLERLLTVDPGAGVGMPTDVTEANTAPGQTFAPFGDATHAGASLFLGFHSPLPFSHQEVGLQINLAEEGRQLLDEPAASDCGALSEESGAQMRWQWWDGTDWDDLHVTGDETGSLARSGKVYFRVPGQIPAVPAHALNGGPAAPSPLNEDRYYWLRVMKRDATYVKPPRIDHILTNTIRATAARTVADEVVGSSTGTPNQVMTLRHAPVLADPPLRLEINGEEWQQIPDVTQFRKDAPQFLLDRSTGRITFGDGPRGRIPVAGQANVVARSYRYGGGAIGNVGAGTITEQVTAVSGVDSVTNDRPAEGGADAEFLAEARVRGPRELLKTRDRAVTLDDFARLSRETPGALVARAAAHLGVTGQGDRMIQVVIVPQSQDPRPVPSEATRRRVCRYLDERRLVTTQLRVAGPRYQEIDLELVASAHDDADLRATRNALLDRLQEYFHPLRGGADRGGWPFGRDVYYSELLREIMLVPGVLRVETLDLHRFLPRPHGTSENPWHDTETAAHQAAVAWVQGEQDVSPCPPTPRAIEIVETTPAEGGEAETHYYAAATYRCCDVPMMEGTLVALRRAEITLQYLRRRGSP